MEIFAFILELAAIVFLLITLPFWGTLLLGLLGILVPIAIILVVIIVVIAMLG